jgi:hypothetical protein
MHLEVLIHFHLALTEMWLFLRLGSQICLCSASSGSTRENEATSDSSSSCAISTPQPMHTTAKKKQKADEYVIQRYMTSPTAHTGPQKLFPTS